MTDLCLNARAVGSRLAVAALLVTACSSPPARAPAAPVDPATAQIVRTWIVADHVVVKGSSITPEDAAGFHGRTLDVTATGFMSPWQGTCEHATRTQRERTVDEVVTELGVVIEDRAKLDLFGLSGASVEYRLACEDRPMPLSIVVAGDKAMTCYGGACYLLNRF